LLERFFKPKENRTTARRELLAGLISFITMAYIIVVNPRILADAGMPIQGVRSVVGNHAGRDLGELLPCPLQDDLDLGLRHRFAPFPVRQVAAVTVQHAAQIVEGAGQIEVRDIHVPVHSGY